MEPSVGTSSEPRFEPRFSLDRLTRVEETRHLSQAMRPTGFHNLYGRFNFCSAPHHGDLLVNRGLGLGGGGGDVGVHLALDGGHLGGDRAARLADQLLLLSLCEGRGRRGVGRWMRQRGSRKNDVWFARRVCLVPTPSSPPSSMVAVRCRREETTERERGRGRETPYHIRCSPRPPRKLPVTHLIHPRKIGERGDSSLQRTISARITSERWCRGSCLTSGAR
jgi:hypothetical protein